MPKQYQPREIEERWNRFWDEGGYFHANPDADGEPYCIVIPPPNVTGVLHMGHGLDETIQDILVRYHRMKGRNVLWVPGTDHAGIATQHVVVEKLHREGRDRHEMGRAAFIEEVWRWKEEQGGLITKQLRRLGCSCDWEREAFTLDPPRARAVRVAFKRLYDAGLIYRGEYLVNWDPVSLTALSDDEVEYEVEKGHLWHLKYPLEDGSGFVVVATTRPETMLGDTAVAVNPTDERWRHLVGKFVTLPLRNRRIPVIADDFVKKDFGSGVVKITPGHDPNDFLCAMRHGLPMINIFTDHAMVNENGGIYAGLDRYKARERVVEDLTALGLIEKIEPHEHRIGRGYRSKSVVEPRLSEQWFVKIKPLAERAQAAVAEGRVRIVPESPWRDVYNHWMKNVRDWCISRQLWWGHRIPIWYRKDEPSVMICYDGDGEPPEVLADPNAWRQDTDVLDTWFSSALWPASVLGWPDNTRDLQTWYPTNVLVTGPDILFFWVARMIMFGIQLVGEKPFHDVYMHSLIFGKSYYKRNGGELKLIPPADAREYDHAASLPPGVETRWEKMSKSKGNVIDPLEVIEEFGTDALRLTVGALAGMGRNIDLDWTRFEGQRNFVNKLWNSARFVLMVTEPLTGAQFRGGVLREGLHTEDRWILSRLARVTREAGAHLDAYEFDRYVNVLYNFTWRDYCDWYLELAKRRVYSQATQGPEACSAVAARVVLVTVLEHICRLLQPVMPFATEEIWQILRERLTGMEPGQHAPDAPRHPAEAGEPLGFRDGFEAVSLALAAWPTGSGVAFDDDSEGAVALLQETVGAIRNIRGEMKVPLDMKVEALIEHADGAARRRLESLAAHVCALASLSRCTVAEKLEHPAFASTYVSGGLTILVPLPHELVEQETARLRKELEFAEKGLASCRARLSNEKFTGKAPADVVEREREKLAKLEADAQSMRAKLWSLGA
ncbi:valine--tRNA ligase [Candidatus Poribacteria bacterium]|nr:valine--tRNA ligase [Candidatus Poribacteria bacterium]